MDARIGSRLPVEIFALGMPAAVCGWTCDVGPGGVCVETESPVGIEDARRLLLQLDGEKLDLKVACQWQREAPGRAGVLNGLRFVSLGEAEARAIWRHVYSAAQELAQFIVGSSSLSELAFDWAVELALHTRLVHFAKGDWIYRQDSFGTRADSAFLVREGRVSTDVRNSEAAVILQDELGEGQIFGGGPMLAEVPHVETAISSSDTTLIEIDPFTLDHLQLIHPDAARIVTGALISRYLRSFRALATATPPKRGSFGRRFHPADESETGMKCGGAERS